MKTQVKTVSTSQFALPLLYLVFAVLAEIINYLYMGFTSASGSIMILPTYVFFDLAIMLIFAGIIYAVQNKWAMISCFTLFLALQFVMYVINTTMYNIFGDILSLDLLKLGGEGFTAIEASFIDWWGALLNSALLIACVVAGFCLVKFNKETVEVRCFAYPIFVMSIFLICASFGLTFYNSQEFAIQTASASSDDVTSDAYLWENFQFKTEAYKKFGFYGFYTKTLTGLVLADSDSETIDLQTYVDFIDDGYVQGTGESASLYGDNLIVILCESLEWYGIDPYNTPTLWSMACGNDTIAFTNYYSRNRTNNSEGIVLNGNMPRNISLYDAYENGYEFDYTLPKLFKSANDGKETVTSYLHMNVGSFYRREDTHGADGLGFDNLYFYDAYTGEQELGSWGEWMSDLEFTSNLMDYFIPDSERFLTFYASMSTHGPYTYENPYMAEYYETYDENFEAFSTWLEEETDFVMPTSEKYLEYLRHYKAGVIDLDRTIANILVELEARGKAENTSILLFADHNAYYYNQCYKMRGLDKTDYSNTSVHNVPVLLYSPKLTAENGGYICDTFCNTYDILPTLCDLYGMDSNSNLTHGYSVFSTDISKSFFSSNLNGMFTEYIYSNNITDVVVLDDSVTEEDISAFQEYATAYYEKQAYIETIYKYGINGTKL